MCSKIDPTSHKDGQGETQIIHYAMMMMKEKKKSCCPVRGVLLHRDITVQSVPLISMGRPYLQ